MMKKSKNMAEKNSFRCAECARRRSLRLAYGESKVKKKKFHNEFCWSVCLHKSWLRKQADMIRIAAMQCLKRELDAYSGTLASVRNRGRGFLS